MSHKKAATLIRSHAEEILKRYELEKFFKQFGELFFTGSYSLDLMTWNDIDMQILLKEGLNPMETFIDILHYLSALPSFIKSNLVNFQGEYKPAMPRGVYLGFHLNVPDLGGIWKLDIWSLASPDFNKNRTLLEQVKKALTETNRQLILEMKHQLQSKQGRVPQMGSHFLYQAILLKGLSSKEDIFDYLRENGVQIA